MAPRADLTPRGGGQAFARVRYPETDRMGIAHHAHYFVWFELARTEWLRQIGVPYRELEEQDRIFLPVVEAGSTYHASAHYDDALRISVALAWLRRVRMRLEYSVVRDGDALLLATGFTVHAAVDGRGRPIRLPARLLRAIGSASGEAP